MKKLTLTILLACTILPAFAASFNVSPILVGLSSQKPTMPLSVSNMDDTPVVIQVRSMSWTQNDSGEDVYANTDYILATPPIFTIPAHGTQIVRIGLREPSTPERELSYRIYLTQLPGASREAINRVTMRFRFGIPVFVTGAAAVAPDLKWSVIASGPNAGKLKVTNDGSAHAQIGEMQLVDMVSEQTIARQPTPVYLLPGISREWALQITPGKSLGTEALRLKAYMDAGDVNKVLVPQQAY